MLSTNDPSRFLFRGQVSSGNQGFQFLLVLNDPSGFLFRGQVSSEN